MQAQKGNEQTDTAGDGHSYRIGQGLKDLLPKAGDSQQYEDNAFTQDQYQSIGVGQTKTDTGGVDEESVQTQPLAIARGKLEMNPARMVPTTAEMAVAI